MATEEKKLCWSFHYSLLMSETKRQKHKEPPEPVVMDNYETQSDSSCSSKYPDSLFVAIDDDAKPKGAKRGNGRGQIHITNVEKDLLEWALNGFLPTGPAGFKAKPGM